MALGKIEITPGGVSVLVKEELFNSAGEVVSSNNHRVARGVGDFESKEAFEADLNALCQEVFGKTLAEGLSSLIADTSEKDALIRSLQAEVADLRTKLATY